LTNPEEANEESSRRELLSRALEEIRRLRKEVGQLRSRQVEPVAVIGVGCRFPGGADDVDQLWQLLRDGRDGLTETPAHRWDKRRLFDSNLEAPGKICSSRGGFIADGLSFDAGFFGIAPVEAQSLDPQQALLLEVVWQAFEQANIDPSTAYNTKTGVFIGASSPDNAVRLMGGPLDRVDAYHGSGCAFAPLAGRVSYQYGLLGPSFVVDTACSSSLVSLHLALDSLQKGESDIALAGGVQLNSHPGFSVTFSKAKMLSPDGRCKTFDKEANGYVRGEGCGVIILKRVSDARADGDTIMALMRGSAVNQDGPSGGLTVPSGPAQVRVIRDSLKSAGLSPNDISYIEAHGTGTALGDPIEVGALGEVFGGGRPEDHPLIIGSLKTNFGHLEAAAGIAGAIKTILTLQKREIPPHLNLVTPNPLISWDELPIRVAKGKPIELPESGRVNAGVSSFGFSGTNAHVVFSTCDDDPVSSKSPPSTGPVVLPISARSDFALTSLARRYEEVFTDGSVDPGAIAAAAWHSRAKHDHRIAVVEDDREKLSAKLGSVVNGVQEPGVVKGVTGSGPDKVVFVFSGQGSQYSGMALGLYESNVEFRNAADHCAQLIGDLSGLSILDVIRDDEGKIDKTQYAQPAIFLVQYALSQLWKSHGVVPAMVVGHSVGEIAAACAAGVLSLHNAVRLVLCRARLMGEVSEHGGLLAVSLAEDVAVRLLDDNDLTVAAINGPSSTVIAGPLPNLTRLEAKLRDMGAKARRLKVSHAFHSPIFSTAAKSLASELHDLEFEKPSCPIALNVLGEYRPGFAISAGYWAQQMISPVRFYDCVNSLLAMSPGPWVEIGPHPTLLPMVRESIEGKDPEDLEIDNSLIPSLKHQSPDSRTFSEACARLWVRGNKIDLRYNLKRDVDLPKYPFQRKRYQVESVGVVSGYSPPGLTAQSWVKQLASPLVNWEVFQSEVSMRRYPELDDHRVFGRRVVAGAFHLAILAECIYANLGRTEFKLSNVNFPLAMSLPGDASRHIQVGFEKEGAENRRFQLISFVDTDSPERQHVSGELENFQRSIRQPALGADWHASLEPASPDAIYLAQRARNIDVGPSYHWLKEVEVGAWQARAVLQRPEIVEEGPGWFLPPGLVDSCFGIFVFLSGAAENETFVPVGFDSIEHRKTSSTVSFSADIALTHVDLEAGELGGKIIIKDQDGGVVLVLQGIKARRTTREALLGEELVSGEDFLKMEWPEIRAATKSLPNGAWLVFTDPFGVGESIAEFLREKGNVVHCEPFDQVDPGYQGSERVDQVVEKSLWRNLPSHAKSWAGIVNCWPLGVINSIEWGTEKAQRVICGSILATVQALRARSSSSSYYVLTQGAVSTKSKDLVLHPHQASAWGLVRTIVRELPDFPIQIVDLEGGSESDPVETISSALLYSATERQIGIRGGKVLTPRLTAVSRPEGRGLLIRPDRAYMVVGAHGGLGASVLKWLVNQGAQELVMVGRRPHTDSLAVKFLTSIGEKRLKIHNLIFSENVDFDVSTLQLDTLERPLGGVFHLAGTLSDQNIETMAWSEFFSPFPAKVDVAVNLVKSISRIPDVPLVMFSSLASLIGSPGQSNYAAANAFLDGLAASGKPNVFSINWGPWDGPGMADRIPPNLKATLMDGGVGFLAPEAALAVLGDIELDSGGHCAVATVDWARWPDKGEVFDRLVQGSPDTTTTGGALRTQLQQRPKAQRRSLLLKKLTEMVAGALHLDRESISPRARLFDLGIDSLTAMQLRSALQLDLSTKLESTLLFDYPTLEKLAAHILDHYVNEDVAGTSQKKKEDSNPGEKINTAELTAALEQLKASLN